MQLLVIILNKCELLNDLLSLMVESGISQSTIFDSEGMGHHLAYEVPIFAGLRQLMGENKEQNKTVFALIEDTSVLGELHKLLKEMDIDFTHSGTGVMFTVQADNVIKPK